MALTTETGAIVPGAVAYVTLTELKAYVGTIALPTATDTAYENAIINATRYIDGKYRDRWLGWRTDSRQALEWPRYNVEMPGGGLAGFGRLGNFFPSNEIPQRLKDAVCEAAIRALSGPLSIDADVSIQSKRIDVLETTYRQGAIPGQQTYQIIDQLISDYLKPLGSGRAIRG